MLASTYRDVSALPPASAVDLAASESVSLIGVVPPSPSTRAHRDLAQSLKSVGEMQMRMSKPAEAYETATRAKAILDDLTQKNAIGAFDRQMVADVERLLAATRPEH